MSEEQKDLPNQDQPQYRDKPQSHSRRNLLAGIAGIAGGIGIGAILGRRTAPHHDLVQGPSEPKDPFPPTRELTIEEIEKNEEIRALRKYMQDNTSSALVESFLYSASYADIKKSFTLGESPMSSGQPMKVWELRIPQDNIPQDQLHPTIKYTSLRLNPSYEWAFKSIVEAYIHKDGKIITGLKEDDPRLEITYGENPYMSVDEMKDSLTKFSPIFSKGEWLPYTYVNDRTGKEWGVTNYLMEGDSRWWGTMKDNGYVEIRTEKRKTDTPAPPDPEKLFGTPT